MGPVSKVFGSLSEPRIDLDYRKRGKSRKLACGLRRGTPTKNCVRMIVKITRIAHNAVESGVFGPKTRPFVIPRKKDLVSAKPAHPTAGIVRSDNRVPPRRDIRPTVASPGHPKGLLGRQSLSTLPEDRPCPTLLNQVAGLIYCDIYGACPDVFYSPFQSRVYTTILLILLFLFRKFYRYS